MKSSRPSPTQQVSLWLAWAGAVTLAAMALLTFVDVIGREVFRRPIPPKVELTELMMGLTVYLGFGLTTITRGHIRVDIVIMYLPVRVRAVLDTFAHAISFVFVAALGWRIWDRMLVKMEKGDVTQLLGIQTWPVAAVMFGCAVVMAVALAILCAESMRGVATGKLPSEAGTPPTG
jgi:TRAP-type C4-dicarboxylate transport system permease small subunit